MCAVCSEMAYENPNQNFHECQCGVVNSHYILLYDMVKIACTIIWLVHNLAYC